MNTLITITYFHRYIQCEDHITFSNILDCDGISDCVEDIYIYIYIKLTVWRENSKINKELIFRLQN